MNHHLKLGLLAGLLAAAAVPAATAALPSAVTICTRHDGDLGDGTGWNAEESSSCVLKQTMTGGQGVGCDTEEWQRGSFGESYPAAYRGQQTCLASVEGSGSEWSVCIGYSWSYGNDGGNTKGDKDGHDCTGLPIAAEPSAE